MKTELLKAKIEDLRRLVEYLKKEIKELKQKDEENRQAYSEKVLIIAKMETLLQINGISILDKRDGEQCRIIKLIPHCYPKAQNY